MEILSFVLSGLNYVLYSVFTWIDAIFNAFDLSWLGIVVGLAVLSVVLRLFAANLIGSAISLHDSRNKPAGDSQKPVPTDSYGVKDSRTGVRGRRR